MSNKKRQEELKTLHTAVYERTKLPGITRELDWSEIAVMTRSGPSKVLGLLDTKGHLGVGADADISIYDLIPDQIDTTVEYAKVKNALSRAAYTIKSGNVVVKDGQIAATPMGRTYWVDATVPEPDTQEMMKDITKKFKNYYSIQLANYMVQDEYITHPRVIKAGAIPVEVS